MNRGEWFYNHKEVRDFVDGEIVYLHVDGIGEVETEYDARTENLYSTKDGYNFGWLRWWLLDENKGANNQVLCPPDLGD